MVLRVEWLQVSLLPLSESVLGLPRKTFYFGTWGGVVGRELVRSLELVSLFWRLVLPFPPSPAVPVLERHQTLVAESSR